MADAETRGGDNDVEGTELSSRGVVMRDPESARTTELRGTELFGRGAADVLKLSVTLPLDETASDDV